MLSTLFFTISLAVAGGENEPVMADAGIDPPAHARCSERCKENYDDALRDVDDGIGSKDGAGIAYKGCIQGCNDAYLS